MQNDTLRHFEDAASVFTQISVWIYVSIERNRLDPQLLAEITNRRVAIGHGGLRHTDLRFCQRKLPSTFPATGAGG
ncbi:hypothetical protein, partial [Sulfitobacter sp. HI0027]|uniref:hypothetical protein n=1 Tax=Sulfitobacter sp. HI0027 TaxID=1822226 RepID=UPI003FCDB6D9